MKTTLAIGLIGAVSMFIAVDILLRRKRLSRFYQRGCAGREWRQRFPEAKKDEIRNFLRLFVHSFGLSEARKLAFSPSDKVFDIYHALYPVRGMPDALEVETLMMGCEERYGVDVTRHGGEDVTLGDFYAVCHNA